MPVSASLCIVVLPCQPRCVVVLLCHHRCLCQPRSVSLCRRVSLALYRCVAVSASLCIVVLPCQPRSVSLCCCVTTDACVSLALCRVAAVAVNETCTITAQCRPETSHAECVHGVCQCQPKYHVHTYSDGNAFCLLSSEYGEPAGGRRLGGRRAVVPWRAARRGGLGAALQDGVSCEADGWRAS